MPDMPTMFFFIIFLSPCRPILWTGEEEVSCSVLLCHVQYSLFLSPAFACICINSMTVYITCIFVSHSLSPAFLFLSYTDPLMADQVLGYDVNWCFIVASIYVAYYSVIELPGVAGPLAAVMAATAFVTVNHVKNSSSYEDPWKLGLAVHVFCWVAQFYGTCIIFVVHCANAYCIVVHAQLDIYYLCRGL
jgi:hypothetical protein